MNARVIHLPIRMLAEREGRRLSEFLKAIETAKEAQAACAAFDACPTRDSAAARDAQDACVIAEDRVLVLALDPNLTRFLGLVLEQLNDITGDAACA